MRYVGKLFGQIGRTRGYFDTGKTSEDWDALEARAVRAEAEVERLRSDRDCEKRLRKDAEELREDAIARAEKAWFAEADLAIERARLDWLMAGGMCLVQHSGGFHVCRLNCQVSRAAIDLGMKEDA